MNSLTRSLLGILCIGIITVCAVMISSRLFARARIADLTENKLYTLSAGTRKIIGQVSQPITLKLYYARTAARKGHEQIRYWNNYYLYVRDLLEEYASISGNKLKLENIDPRPFSDEEEEAIKHKVKRFQLPGEEAFFFGLAATTEHGKSKVIEFFEPDRQEFVEYDVSKLISDLMRREKKKIGVISSLPVTGSDMSPYMMQMMQMQRKPVQKPWLITTDLKQSYEVTKVKVENAKIPEDIDFLMVIHPKNLDEETLFAIDQFVMGGGKLIVFVDPYCMLDQPPPQPRNPYANMNYKASSNLNSLLRRWGVETDPDRIAVDRVLAQKIRLRMDAAPQTFLPMLLTNDDCMNKDEIISAELHDLILLFAGTIKTLPVDGVTVTPLIQTTAIGSTWKPANPFELKMPDADKIRKAVVDGTKPLNLACILKGKFKTNFPKGIEKPGEDEKKDEPKEEKPPESKEGEIKPPEKKRLTAIAEAAQGATVIVIADVDFMSDMRAYRQSFFGAARQGDAAPLIQNTIDFLAGADELIAIRTRGRYSRPFVVVKEIEKQADKETAIQIDAINQRIKNYQEQLAKLGKSANEDNIELLQNTALQKRRALDADIRKENKKLRQLKSKRREKVEALKSKIQFRNIASAPAITLLIAIALAAFRFGQARRFAQRRL